MAGKVRIMKSYREIQTLLKQAREKGFEVSVKLNAKYEILEAEYNRLLNSSISRMTQVAIQDIMRIYK